MKKRRSAFRGDIAHHLAHKHTCITSPARIGMRTHRAHFNESRHPHPLPRHRQQPASLKNAVEIPQLNRPLAKWPGLSKRRQFHHRRNISSSEPLQCRRALQPPIVHQSRLAADHLRERTTPKQTPSRRGRRWIREKQAQQSTRPGKIPESTVALQRLIRRTSQRSDCRRESANLSLDHRNAPLIRSQCVPDRIVQQFFRRTRLAQFELFQPNLLVVATGSHETEMNLSLPQMRNPLLTNQRQTLSCTLGG